MKDGIVGEGEFPLVEGHSTACSLFGAQPDLRVLVAPEAATGQSLILSTREGAQPPTSSHVTAMVDYPPRVAQP